MGTQQGGFLRAAPVPDSSDSSDELMRTKAPALSSVTQRASVSRQTRGLFQAMWSQPVTRCARLISGENRELWLSGHEPPTSLLCSGWKRSERWGRSLTSEANAAKLAGVFPVSMLPTALLFVPF